MVLDKDLRMSSLISFGKASMEAIRRRQEGNLRVGPWLSKCCLDLTLAEYDGRDRGYSARMYLRVARLKLQSFDGDVVV